MARTLISDPAAHDLSTIVGHDIVKQYLCSATEQDALPHALLFAGPDGVGKTSMAFATAKLLNCAKDSRGGCPCEACRKITGRVFADVLTVGPKGAAGQITLSGWKPGSDPENLQYYRFVDTRPIEGRAKVLIIDQAERMNIALANYLLKLIEEPPSYLKIILLTHRPSELLTTIRSRCSPLRFAPLTVPEMEAFAKTSLGIGSEVDRIAIVRFAEGRPGNAIEYAEGNKLAAGKQLAQALRKFHMYGFPAVFGTASALQSCSDAGSRGGDGLEGVLNALQAWWRDVLIVKTMPEPEAVKMIAYREAMDDLKAYAGSVSLEGLGEALDQLKQLNQYTGRLTDRGYLLELMLIRIGRAMKR